MSWWIDKKNEAEYMEVCEAQIKNQREIWVDNVKVIACVLVVLGHFFQSMTQSEILPANDIYNWFNQTIYYFHVPLFFICSGYLYQKRNVVIDLHSWGKNVLKKLLALGIPYFTFSFVTWILKTLFSSSVNNEIGGLVETLFFYPTAPYWYLYALFLLFLITPIFKNVPMTVGGIFLALSFKIVEVYGGYTVQAISYILSNEIWFAIGMCLSVLEFKKYLTGKGLIISIIIGAIFLFLSIVVYVEGIEHGLVRFLLGLLACCSVIMTIGIIYKDEKQSVIFGIIAKYTMPVFLMHTLFAAPLRTVLLKLNVQNAVVHVVLGIVISFVGPIMAAIIMKKSKWLEFFLYPGKFIKIK